MSIDHDPSADAQCWEVTTEMAALLPPENPHSQTLFRLCLPRDDLTFELLGLYNSPTNPLLHQWRWAYFARRLSSTLSELKDLFSHHVDKLIDDLPGTAEVRAEVIRYCRDAQTAIKKADEFCRPIRDRGGVHARFRPEDFSRVLRRLAAEETQAVVRFSNKPVHADFKGVSAEVINFIWPDAGDEEEIIARLGEYDEHIQQRAMPCVEAVDTLLSYLWVHAGELDPAKDGLHFVEPRDPAALWFDGIVGEPQRRPTPQARRKNRNRNKRRRKR